MRSIISYSLMWLVTSGGATGVMAQETFGEPYYRMKTELPGAVEMADGTKADAILSYFVNAKGSVEGMSLMLDAKSSSREECYDNPPPGFCIIVGIEGAVANITLRSVPDANGFDVGVDIRQFKGAGGPGFETRSFEVPGLDVTNDGAAMLRKHSK